jgi:predicted RND superfamily exporter protein
VVIIEGDDVTKPEVLKAMLRTSQQMETVPKATGTQSIANIVADAWSEETGVREIPSSQEEIDKILSSAQESVPSCRTRGTQCSLWRCRSLSPKTRGASF